MPNGEQRDTNQMKELKISPFIDSDPDFWIWQLEHCIEAAGIITDKQKFNVIAGNLEARYALEIKDALTAEHDGDAYVQVKTFKTTHLVTRADEKYKLVQFLS